MDPAQKDPREMTDEEAILWMQELINKLLNEKGTAGGACSLEAVKNPARRNILLTLEKKPLNMNEIAEKLGVKENVLKYHLNFLLSSYFIQIEGDMVDLTPGGVAFVRSAKRN